MRWTISLAAALLAGTAASAASYDVTIGGAGGSGTASFSFAGFDASQGTLTSVDFTISSTTNFAVTTPFNPNDPAPPSGTATYDLKAGYFLYVSGPIGQPYVQQSGTGSAPLTFGAFDATVTGANGVTSYAVTTATLRDFFSQATITGYGTSDPPFFRSVQFNGVNAGSLDFAVTSSSFSGTVTYNFTPLRGEVPEPASWAMLVAGFGLAGTALRRRATAAHA